MATVKTLYSALGLDPTASSRDIDEAFTRLRLRYTQLKDPDEAQRIAFGHLDGEGETDRAPEAEARLDPVDEQHGRELRCDVVRHVALPGVLPAFARLATASFGDAEATWRARVTRRRRS